MASGNDTYDSLTCKHCNAHLRIDVELPTVTCEYCGATYRTSDLIDVPQREETPDPYNGMGEPERGRGMSSGERRAKLIRIFVGLIFLSVVLQGLASFIADDSSSSSSSVSSTSTVISIEPAPPASSSSSASSSASSSSNTTNVVPELAIQKNPDAATPEFRQQVDDLEEHILDCLQDIADGKNSMEPTMNMLLSLDEFNDIDDSNLTAADKAYLRETLSHTVSLIPQVMGSSFKLNLSGKVQSYL